MVRVRFAPSPTGYLHVGGLRTAFYNWLLARREGGTFLLRIEDTDRTRLVEGAVEALLEALNWAGITPDEGAVVGGPLGPYVQSERLEIYREMASRLVESGHAYHCFCTPERLAEMREQQMARGESAMYDRHCRNLDPAERDRRLAAGEPHVIRMKIPDGRSLTVEDQIRGPVSFDSSLVDEQVLMKSDGFPTYHLAAVVDDHLMEITHVVRGEEWLSSTPKHLLLYEYFGWKPPVFAHVPLILNASGKKLSKRDGDVSVEAYREKGYLPEGLLNFLALLGWSPGDEREFFTPQELSGVFSLDRVRKSGAVFDFDKLLHINGLHMRAQSTSRLVELVLPFFDRAGWPRPESGYLAQVIEVMGERANLLTDYVEPIPYFYADPAEYEPATVKKRWKAASPELMEAWVARLEALEVFGHDALDEALRTLAESRGVGAGQLIHPTRLALTGVGNGPGLFEMMEVLGREVCLRRLRTALDRLPRP